MPSPGTTGTETPPGMTALSWRPPRTPPQISSRSLNGMPSGSSMFCGLFSFPGDAKNTAPARPAADLQQILERDAERQFDVLWLVHMPGHREDHRARGVRHAELDEPL